MDSRYKLRRMNQVIKIGIDDNWLPPFQLKVSSDGKDYSLWGKDKLCQVPDYGKTGIIDYDEMPLWPGIITNDIQFPQVYWNDTHIVILIDPTFTNIDDV